MKTFVDLHTHSSFSDGVLSPTELVTLASKTGITTLALTDHDTVNGLEEAFEAGKKLQVEIISGIEVSVIHDHLHLHILGYGFHPEAPELKSAVDQIQQARVERNIKIIEKLQNMGKEITMAELRRQPGRQIGRPHIAQLLASKGYVKNVDDAFRRLLRDGGPAYVAGYKLTAQQAIEIITDAGGLAVLAHPGKIGLAASTLEQLVRSLGAIGLAGLETFYPRHPQKTIKKLKKLCDQFQLEATGGSDFHGLPGYGDQLGLAGGACLYPEEAWQRFKAKLVAGHALEPSR